MNGYVKKIKNYLLKIISFYRSSRKKAILIGLSIVIVLVTISGLVLYWPRSAGAAWFNDLWPYRNLIHITSHTAAESGVYVSVTIDTSATGLFKSNCGDLRWTDYQGNLLPYYIVSGCTTSSTVVHVYFENFPAGAQDIFYYYGNPNALDGFNSADFAAQATSYAIGSTGSQEKTVGPIAYWQFDDATGTTVKDYTKGGHDGTLSGTIPPLWQSDKTCVSGKCLYFDGTSANVSVASVIRNIQTVSLWVRPNIISNSAIIDLDGGTHTITISSGTVSASGFSSPIIYVNGSLGSTLTVNTWQQVTITTTTGFNSSSSLTIGKSSSTYFQGFIDEVKLYNYDRSAAQVRVDNNSQGSANGTSVKIGASTNGYLSTLSNGLVGYYKMDTQVPGTGHVALKVDTTAPTTPGTPSTGDPSSNPEPTWTWTPSTDSGSGVSYYNVQWCTDPAYTGCGSNVATSTTATYTHTSNLTTGTWYFKAQAVDAVGNTSSFSSSGTFTKS